MSKIIKRGGTAPTLSNKLGDMLQRRRLARVGEEVAEVRGVHDGGVVEVSIDSLPLTDMLGKSRYMTRPPRGTAYLHVSDILSKCLRRIALMDRLDIPARPQSLSLTDSLTFAQGDAIHDVLRARAARGAPHMAWGNWSCKCGVSKTSTPSLLSGVDQEVKCHACEGPRDVYTEVPVFDEHYKIVGNPDFLLYLPAHQAIHVTELKSISHEKWKELARPIPDHVLQVMFYWFLMNRKGFRLTDKVSILYATKGWMFSGEPFKEFVVDVTSMLPRLNILLEDALAVKAARAGGDLPPRICAAESAPEAKKCDVCKQCFGLLHENTPVTVSIASALASSRKKG